MSGSKAYKGEIHTWCKIYHGDNLFSIFGKPVGHPTFVNWIRTSSVVSIEEDIAETQNSLYKLIGPELSLTECMLLIKGKR